MPSPCDLAQGLRPFEEALEHLLESLRPLDRVETVPLEASLGRCVAEAVHSPLDFPPFSNAAMDGLAVRAAEALPGARLKILGTVLAGQSSGPALGPLGCVRIFTGAPLPPGADAVVIQEQVVFTEDLATLAISEPVRAGAHVRKQGEERLKGAQLLEAGQRIGPYEAGLLAFAGFAEVKVRRPLNIGLLATGEELVKPGGSRQPGQIFESNRPVLAGLVQKLGHRVTDYGWVGDDRAVLSRTIEMAHRGVDALITTGGASEGAADHLSGLLAERGRVDFWKVAIKPGKPFIFGWLGDCPVFGLPGNPVSAAVTFLALVRPALDHLAGVRATSRCLRLPLAQALRRQPGRREFLRARLVTDSMGTRVLALPQQGSHCLTSLALADGLIHLDAAVEALPEGALVTIELLFGAERGFGGEIDG